jgi:hypothetical protein
MYIAHLKQFIKVRKAMHAIKQIGLTEIYIPVVWQSIKGNGTE